MMSYICKTHSEYPTRLDFNNLHYKHYKDTRPFFFHDILLKHNHNWSETLVPNIQDFKNKFSYITSDYILNSNLFEYCIYDIYDKDVKETKTVYSMLPLNPYGPTGIGGRGLLGKWGPNHCADSVVITYDEKRKIYQLLVIERSDTPDIYALPGGMNDNDELISSTLQRELKEETNIILSIEDAQFIYSGYVNDPRNTDHSWIETCVYMFYLTNDQRKYLLNNMKHGDDATNVKLIDIKHDNKDYINLYSNHREFVEMSIQILNISDFL